MHKIKCDMNKSQEISKIKTLDNTIYNIKDSELRYMINVLLGIEKPKENNLNESTNDNKKCMVNR